MKYNETKNLKNRHLTEKKLQEVEEQLKRSKIIIQQKQALVEELDEIISQTEGELKKAEEIIQQSDEYVKRESPNLLQTGEELVEIENPLKGLNAQINNLVVSFYELDYFNNTGRTFKHRFFSKFPSLYIMLKGKDHGMKNALINIKGYRAIKKHNLFDIGYYLVNYPDVRRSGADPLLHYIYNGYKKGYKPNKTFNGKYYLKKYKDVKNSNINPLVHYSLYGIKEERNME